MERKKIKKLLAQSNYEDAYTYVNEIINKKPKNNEFIPLKGYIEFKLEKYDIAKNTLKTSLKNNLNAEESWKYLAEIYLHECEYLKAYTSYKMCIKKLGITSYVYKRIISLSLFLEKYDEAKYYAKLSSTYPSMRRNKNIVPLIDEYIKTQNQTKLKTNTCNNTNVAMHKEYLDTQQKQTIEHKINDDTNVMPENELIEPNNRNKLVFYVYELIKNKEIEKALTLLQKASYKNNIEELAQYIIFIEWYDLLYKILIALNDTKYCLLKLNIANTIFHVFERIRSSFYCLFFYLVEEENYEDLQGIFSIKYYDAETYSKTREIVKEILNLHPDYDLNSKECTCCKVDVSFDILYNFNTKKNYITTCSK
ncbi:hypothetical protein BDAP_001012 [Binucleata daphniae]